MPDPRPPEREPLLKSPEAFARILDLADDAIVSVDEQQRIILFNQGAERIFGYSRAEVEGRPLDILLPERLTPVHRRDVRRFGESPETARRMGERGEILGRRRDGSEFPAEATISKVVVDGRPMYTAILRDVTQRALGDERIRASLREKEALLREIHHRVKNNLQVVSSLLGLQSRGARDPQLRRLFLESQNRIHSMAMLHESLYQSDDLSQIDFPEYIQRLADHLFRSYGITAERITLRSFMHPLRLNMDTAMPCGLIVNEVVSNSLKYAFPGDRKGQISISLQERGDGIAELTIADDGVGIPAEIDVERTASLGLRLVRSLSHQLGATAEFSSTGGTTFRLAFPAAGVTVSDAPD